MHKDIILYLYDKLPEQNKSCVMIHHYTRFSVLSHNNNTYNVAFCDDINTFDYRKQCFLRLADPESLVIAYNYLKEMTDASGNCPSYL